MASSGLKLPNPPIVEAVIDIDCDMAPLFDPAMLEDESRKAFGDKYPTLQKQFLEEHRIESAADQPPKIHSAPRKIQSLRQIQEDGKQLVQVRAQGFSFNRLAPYEKLDDYLPEIERTWRLFVRIAAPVEVRAVRLRYINRILLPLVEGRVKLEDYFRISPRLPDEDNLELTRFLDRYAAVEKTTGHQVNIVMASQAPEPPKLPVILDIGVSSVGTEAPDNWVWILNNIKSLRLLKNRIFQDTLTEQCLELFRQ